MKTVCASYPIGKFMSWECYHGIGHGLMYYTENNMPRSIELCDTYGNAFARSSCSNGVFMENFNTDQKLHPSQFLKKDDLFYPCAEQVAEHRGDCYLYAPTHYLSLHTGDYSGAMEWCKGAEFFYRSACIEGVGSQAMKENINNPKVVEAVCMDNASCIDGMVGLYINHYASLEPARILCGELAPSNRKTCYGALEKSAILFTN